MAYIIFLTLILQLSNDLNSQDYVKYKIVKMYNIMQKILVLIIFLK